MADRPGHHHGVARGFLEGSRSDVDPDAADVAVPHLDLARVYRCADLETELAERLPEPERASESASRRVECGQDAVTGRLDEVAVPSAHLCAREVVVLVQQLPPCAV